MQSAMNALNPVMSVGAQFADALRAHGMSSRKAIAVPLRRGAAARRHRRGAPAQLPAPAVRRDAAARDDRDGAAVHAGPGHHGRAHLGARRGGAALADDADQGAAAGVRLRGHLRHPRHVAGQPLLRPAARDVRGPGRGVGPDPADLRQPAAPLLARAARRLPRHPRARRCRSRASPARRQIFPSSRTAAGSHLAAPRRWRSARRPRRRSSTATALRSGACCTRPIEPRQAGGAGSPAPGQTTQAKEAAQ